MKGTGSGPDPSRAGRAQISEKRLIFPPLNHIYSRLFYQRASYDVFDMRLGDGPDPFEQRGLKKLENLEIPTAVQHVFLFLL